MDGTAKQRDAGKGREKEAEEKRRKKKVEKSRSNVYVDISNRCELR